MLAVEAEMKKVLIAIFLTGALAQLAVSQIQSQYGPHADAILTACLHSTDAEAARPSYESCYKKIIHGALRISFPISWSLIDYFFRSWGNGRLDGFPSDPKLKPPSKPVDIWVLNGWLRRTALMTALVLAMALLSRFFAWKDML
jgi:hypothetical protein